MSMLTKRTALFAVAAAAVVAVVVVALAGGSGGSHRGSRERTAPTAASGGELAAAASYLGLSRPQLRRELRAGHSLASVVGATAGKSRSGLIEAIVAARRASLDKLRAAGVISPADERARLAKARARALGEVSGTPRPAVLTPRDATAAAAYLGVSRARLTSELGSGKTLAQLAAATPERSASGLIDALVTERHELLNTEVTAGLLSPARRAAFLLTVRGRMTALVNRSHPTAGASSRGPG
jgi:hypothetical protein